MENYGVNELSLNTQPVTVFTFFLRTPLFFLFIFLFPFYSQGTALFKKTLGKEVGIMSIIAVQYKT